LNRAVSPNNVDKDDSDDELVNVISLPGTPLTRNSKISA